MMTESCDLGLIGLAVMGQNLVLNFESRGYRVAVHNRTLKKMDEFMAGPAAGKQIVATKTMEEMVAALKRPRKIMLMVKAGSPVDAFIDQLLPLLDPGDILIDGGNTHFEDTERRTKQVEAEGLLFVGTGVSGGEEGALKGPSLMPGGSDTAWEHVQEMFQAISAKCGPTGDVPCCQWLGPRGAGHYVKMVHNGIEYGDMQLICESYHLLKEGLGLDNDTLYDVFAKWNQGVLQSYLIEITRDIFSVLDSTTGDGHLVDKILDTAGAKGTGKWMSQHSLDLGVPSTLVTTAVFARGLSAMKPSRMGASESLQGPPAVEVESQLAEFSSDRQAGIDAVEAALYASKICSYAQGFVQLREASSQYNWDLDMRECAALWRGGCIIRAQFLEPIMEAFSANRDLDNLLLAEYFNLAILQAQDSWRKVVAVAARIGIPVPAFSAALAYYDSVRRERLPANLLQAQRDYFGAHTYRRIDREGSFHTDWLRERRSLTSHD